MVNILEVEPTEVEFFCFAGKDIECLRDPRNPDDVPPGHPDLLVPAGSRVRITRIFHDDMVEFYFAESKRVGIAYIPDFTGFDEALCEFNKAYTNDRSLSPSEKISLDGEVIDEEQIMRRYEALWNPGPSEHPSLDLSENKETDENLDIEIARGEIENNDTVVDGAENPIVNAQATSTPKERIILEETPTAPGRPDHPLKKNKRTIEEVDKSYTQANAAELNRLSAIVENGFRKANQGQMQHQKNIDLALQSNLKQIDAKVQGSEKRIVEASKAFTLGHIGEIEKKLATVVSNLQQQINDQVREAEEMDYTRRHDPEVAELKGQVSELRELLKVQQASTPSSKNQFEELQKQILSLQNELQTERAKAHSKVAFATKDRTIHLGAEKSTETPLARSSIPVHNNRYTSMFLNDTFEINNGDSNSNEKSIEHALRFVRQHPDKVPQRVQHRSTNLALFLCKVVLKFAKNQGLMQTNMLDQWLPYAFPEATQTRVNFLLQNIRKRLPHASMYDTFRELAQNLEPDSFLSLDNLEKRKSGETIVDFVMRLCSDFPICQEVSESEMPRRVLQHILSTERDATLIRELRRELLAHSGQLTELSLYEMAVRVDRLLNTTCSRFAVNSVEANSEINAIMENQHQMQAAISHLYAVKDTAKCKQCNKAHNSKRPGGTPWNYCQECYINVIKKGPHQRRPTYNSPPVSRRSSKRCQDCNSDAPIGRNGLPMSRCRDCHSKYRASRGPNPKFNISAYDEVIRREAEEIGIDQIENAVTRSQILAINVDSIRKVNKICAFKADRYRMKAKVFNSDKSKVVSGLIDTGCNTDALSLNACKHLGIENQIQPHHSLATGVDGHNLKVVGSVFATLNIGDVKYTNTFPVLEKIDSFDVMIGTRFMQSTDLMTKVVDLMKDSLGPNNVERVN